MYPARLSARCVPLLSILLLLQVGCVPAGSVGVPAAIRVSNDVVRERPHRLGVNIGPSFYWDDMQHVANPMAHGGFAKGRQTLVVQVAPGATGNTFADAYFERSDPDRHWVDSMAGGEYCIATGARAGERGAIVAHDTETGTYTLEHAGEPLAEQDVVWVTGPWTRRATPDPASEDVEPTIGIGDFRPILDDGVRFDFVDTTNGETDQALRFTFGPGAGRARGGVKHYVRGTSAVTYKLHVIARGEEGMRIGAGMRNFGIPHPDEGNALDMIPGNESLLSGEWKEFVFVCTTPDDARIRDDISVIELVVSADAKEDAESVVEIDAIWLEDSGMASPHGFNRRMAEALKEARCGTLRFYGVASLGSLVEDFTAKSTVDSTWTYASLESSQRFNATDAVLDQWMQLCLEVGARPWITVPSANGPAEWEKLIAYLAGAADGGGFGARRAANGHAQPWTERFDKIYLEIGNEWWNPIFRPFHVMPPEKYGELCRTILRAVTAHPDFDADRIHVVVAGWAANAHHWNGEADRIAEGHSHLSIAPYLLQELDDYASTERNFRTLFADVEGYAATGGASTLRDLADNGKGTKLAVYELNTHLTGGGAPASIASKLCPSAGAGVAVLDQAMTLMRDMGASPINYFTIFQRAFDDRAGLWGTMIRQPDGSLRARPVWHGLRLANQYLIEGDLVRVEVAGSPTWNQPENGSVPELDNVPFLHAFAFRRADGYNVLVINRHPSESLGILLELPEPVADAYTRVTLAGAKPDENNEREERVRLDESSETNSAPEKSFTLPPASATVFRFDLLP